MLCNFDSESRATVRGAKGDDTSASKLAEMYERQAVVHGSRRSDVTHTITMLENITIDDCSPLNGDAFAVDIGDTEPLSLELVEVKSLGEAPDERFRAPFSLLFHGPLRPLLPQRTYAVQHAEMGSLELFLVALGPNADGTHMRYESVFN